MQHLKSMNPPSPHPLLFLSLISFFLFPVFSQAKSTMTWGDLSVTAEEMGMEKKGELFFAKGEVIAVRQGVTLICDEALYDSSAQTLKALGNVQLSRETSRIKCGFLVLFEREKRGLARLQPIIIRDLKRDSFRKNPDGSIPTVLSKVALMGKEIELFHEAELVYARGDAVAKEVPNYIEDDEILFEETEFLNKIYADTIEIHGKTARSIGRGNVRILTDELISTGQKGIYLKDKNRLIMTGQAIVFQSKAKALPEEGAKTNLVQGDKVVVFPETNQTVIIGTVKSKIYQSPGM